MDSPSPTVQIWRRFRANVPAMISLGVVAIAFMISVLGYLIMPDPTPDANDGAIQVQKLPPGSEATFLMKKRQLSTPSSGGWHTWLYGKESEYTLIPIESYEIRGWDLLYTTAGRIHSYEHIPMIEVVMTPGREDTTRFENTSRSYYYHHDTVYTLQGTIYTQRELIREIEQAHIQKRRYLLGTDKAGRDVLSRLILGTRISLGIGLASAAIALLLGVVMGAFSGFFGGKTDAVASFFMSTVLSVPNLLWVLAISLALNSRSIWILFVSVGLTSWVEVARVVRGQIVVLKEKTFVEAAKALGASNFDVVYRHIVPNLWGPIIVVTSSTFASALLAEAGLSFLEMGVQAPTPSWGLMVHDGFKALGSNNSWHLILFPSLCISILVLSFNVLANGLRDALDPQRIVRW